MKEVSPQARQYLDALRTADAPAADASARVWDGVQARAAAGDLGPDLPGEPSGLVTAGGATSIKSIVLGVLVGTGVAIGGAAAIIGSTSDDPTPIAASPVVDVVAPVVDEGPTPAPAPAPMLAVEPEELIEIEEEPADTSPIERPRAKGTRPRTDTTPAEDPIPSVDPVAEEVAMLADARSALGAGEASRAILVLARHRKRFPEGLLARERDVSWITALCVLGRVDEARTRAKSFLRAHGSSPHAAKVRASCGGKDE